MASKEHIQYRRLGRIAEAAMGELVSTVTATGQVTIPVPIRRRLRVAPGDKVAFVVEADRVRLVRKGSVVERTAGAFGTVEAPLEAEALRQVAERAIAEDVVERMGG
jgi:AbrB family looped-hinge helix DNA binding protein